MCAHSLVSPLIAPMDVLRLFPAVYACTGWEGMTDETEVFIRRLAKARERDLDHGKGIRVTPNDTIPKDCRGIVGEVVFDGYIGMPHTFAFMTYNKAGIKADTTRANHIKNAVANQDKSHALESQLLHQSGAIGQASWTNVKTMKESSISFADLGMTSEFSGYTRVDPLTDELVFEKVEEGRVFRVQLERRLRDQERDKEAGKA